MARASTKGARATGKRVAPPRPRFPGWATSDEDEIERRRMRARDEGILVEPLEPEYGVGGTFLARSQAGEGYRVELRSLEVPINSCDCPDCQINGLGTCKHIEAVLLGLAKPGKAIAGRRTGSGIPRIEVFLEPREERVKILWPVGRRSSAHTLLAPFFSADDTLLADPLSALPALERAVGAAAPRVRSRIRISRHLQPWLERRRRAAEHERARRAFEADVASGKRSLDVVSRPLYAYQQQGMLHLAFTGRALLADEMGLGKTVQAVAACELLRRLHGIQRVLVVGPASLKAEWQEQIAKFTALPTRIIEGPRASRLRQYREPAFFYLANYEQILSDRADITAILAPDVIVLDEAQRIKNWRTKTAEAVKRLSSPYAFVLTGTPMENRIDEIYSIVQFLDPHILGPLFRFNRDFYTLDEQGRPLGYKNLDELHRRLRPLMLRRRKAEVEDQLPGRTVNTYFVELDAEQQIRYDEYETKVARLLAVAKRRALTKEEMDKLQRWLACMRMLCDTPYILDADCRVSPKLVELEAILQDLMDDAEPHKIIVFSEWERMLELVRELADRLGLGYAWHTGTVPQTRRRTEIRRFKDDPDCRLFLSTDSGSVGLNLQAADVVIILDQPWNPAKLEQRIARAWRKHQRRTVQVINLVTEHTIEHRMLHLLEQKRTLALGVVDGAGELTEMALPSGRAAFMERLDSLLGQRPAEAPASPARSDASQVQALREDVLARWGDRVHLLELHRRGAERVLLAVLDRVDQPVSEAFGELAHERLGDGAARLELMDRSTYETIQRLIAAGVLGYGPQRGAALHRSTLLQAREDDASSRRLQLAQERFQQAEPKQRMARVLADGGFPLEALAPLHEGVELALRSLAGLVDGSGDGPVSMDFLAASLIAPGMLAGGASGVVARLRQGGIPQAEAGELLAQADALFEQVATALSKASLGQEAVV